MMDTSGSLPKTTVRYPARQPGWQRAIAAATQARSIAANRTEPEGPVGDDLSGTTGDTAEELCELEDRHPTCVA